jgi:hypothetical protein
MGYSGTILFPGHHTGKILNLPVYFIAETLPGALSLELKRSGREADHSPPSNAEVKRMSGAILPLPTTSPWRGAQLKHWDNFTFLPFTCMFYCRDIIASMQTGALKMPVNSTDPFVTR